MLSFIFTAIDQQLASIRNIALQNIKNGDESSFRSIFDEFYDPLVRFANSYLFDLSEAKDVVQCVFIKIWEKSEELQIETSIESYLFTCVKNSCLNRLKSLKVTDQHQLLMVEGVLEYYAENDRMDVDLEEELRKAIAKLPHGIQEIIQLKYAQNKKISEISAILKISENTIKTQLKRGKQKLREGMGVSQQSLIVALCVYFSH